MVEIKTRKVKLTDIHLNPDNPRRISGPAMDRLVKSLQEFPEMLALREIVVDETMTVLGGNMRTLALRKIGAKECTAKIVKGLTPEQKRRFVITDNGQWGEWDMDALANEWGDLPLVDWGVDLPEDWMKPPLEATEDGFDPDAAADAIKCPVTQPGQIWTLGKHRIMCGDSTKADDVKRLMGGAMADMLLTDPPYGVSYAAKNEYLNAIAPGNRIQTPIEHDHEAPEEMSRFWVAAFSTIQPYIRPGGCYYVTGPQGGDLLLLLLLALRESGYPLRHMLIWVKNNHVLGRADYNYKHEPIIYGWIDGAGHKFYSKHDVSTWEVDKPLKSDLHPTMKPVELFARAIRNSSLAGETVLDPFLGSGTTIVAAEQLGRVAVGLEHDPTYCDVIIQRWEALTGNKAVLAEEGS